MRRWGRLLVDVIAWFGLTIAVHVLVLRQLSWSWQPAIVLSAFAPYLALGAVPAAVLFGARRRWVGLAAAVVVTLVLLAVELPLYQPTFHTAHRTGSALTMLQANLRLGSADAAKLVARVRSEHVDLLSVEELSPGELTRLDAAGLGAALPYRFANPHDGGDGIGMFSRFPLTDEHYDDDHFGLGFESARAAGPTGPITLYAVHLTPPWPYPSHHWTGEIARLRTLLRQRPATGPLIVGGDFNATYDNAQFRALLGDGIDDADRSSGSGLLPTYPTDRFYPPLIGIDHVLTRAVQTAGVRTVALPGSDHRGLLVHLLIPT